MQTTDLKPAAGPHLVQFYEAEEFLFDAVGTYLAEGLLHGEPVVVIATPEHRHGFEASLRAKGADPSRATLLDARAVLAQFMVGAMPDESRFMTVVGGMLEPLIAGGARPRIRAYGEMVDVLWRDGNAEAAIRLEQLWNELGTLYPFTLLCAYQMRNFHKERDTRLFADVCDTHGRVFPAESYSRCADDDTRLREIAALQQRAAALEAEIEHRRELERALRAGHRIKDEFLAALSHELRTPLTAILGWSRLMTLGTLDEPTTRLAIETIERSARTQTALIDDLLDLSRVATGKLTLRSEAVDLTVAVDNAVETLRLAAEARNIRIDVSHAPEHCVVTGDSTRLQQVAWNLLSNAVKFSDVNSTVSVAVESNGESARLTVRDTGRGIPSAFLPHVFEPFRQADGASTRSHNGLGLGLAIVKYLVELHGGHVAVANNGEEAGATFTVTLPVSKSA